jgi:hypothetical protein
VNIVLQSLSFAMQSAIIVPVLGGVRAIERMKRVIPALHLRLVQLVERQLLARLVAGEVVEEREEARSRPSSIGSGSSPRTVVFHE